MNSPLSVGRPTLLEATAATTGAMFFQVLVEHLAQTLGAKWAMVAEIVEEHPKELRLVASSGPPLPAAYPLPGTPCQQALQNSACSLADSAHLLFPEDGILRERQVEAWMGAAVQDIHGQPVGIVAVMHDAPLNSTLPIKEILEPLGTRLEAEMDRRRDEATLRRQTQLARSLASLATTLATEVDDIEKTMVNLCRQVAEILGMHAAAVVVDQGGRPERRYQYGVPVSLTRAQHILPSDWLEAYNTLLRQNFTVADAREHPLGRLPAYSGIGLRSVATAPLRWGGEHLGILVGMTFWEIRYFTQEEQRWLTTVASHVGQAMANLRLLQAMQAREAQYRQIVDSCLEGIWTIDLEGRTTFVNHQLATMFRTTPEQMQKRTMFDYIDAEGKAQAEQNLRRRREGIGERHPFRFRLEDGEDLWTEMSTNPLYDDQGHPVGALAMITDVTERRALEQKFQQAQKLESLGVLAGGLAHDFNNLLVGILGNVGVALQDVPPESPTAAALGSARSAAQRASELTNQMLAYAGKTRIVARPCSINQLIQEMAELASSAVSRRITLRYNLTNDLPSIQADATQIRQIILNLLTNAADALQGEAGVIRVSTGVMQATRAYLKGTWIDEDLPPGEYVWLEVQDTGCGMDPATLQRIFDPFFTTRFAGRGLGLAAVLGILRRHHGAIRVESALGVGSTFRVLFPASREAVDLRPAAEPAPTPSRSYTVLVVDDEDLVRQVARRVLERAGHRVMEASCGEVALELLGDIPEGGRVLLDMTMPGMSGEAVYEHLQKLRPDLKVLLTSGYSEQEAHRRFGEELSGFLQKPWTPLELLRALPRD